MSETHEVVNLVGGPPARSLPDHEWENSPMYLALSSRLAKIESTFATLSAQVNQLSQIATAALPSSLDLSNPSQFNPPLFDQSLGVAPSKQSITPSSSTASDAAIALLSQQVSALSTSVAQLQRLQQSQSQSQSQGSQLNSVSKPLILPNTDRNQMGMPRHLQDFISGPMTTPNAVASLVGQAHGAVGSSRPLINRSISSSVIGAGVLGDPGRWGTSSSLTGNGREWPGPSQGLNGGLLTPSGSGNGLSLSGLGGAAAPGAGIVVTKWEHLNLRAELLRSITKYG